MNEDQLGKQIAKLRKAKGLSQEELAARCKINVRSLQRIEAGEVVPRGYTLRAILAGLEVDHTEFCRQFEIDDEDRDNAGIASQARWDLVKRTVGRWSFPVYILLLLVFAFFVKFGMPWYLYILPVLLIFLIKTGEYEPEAN